ncbi:MAG TPA: DnaA N-terminal domain-containing protein, partial [Verrucomicrobiae bacterium]
MQISAETIWNTAQEHLRVKLSRDTYNMWFAPLRASEVDGQQLTIETPNEFCEVWLKDNYLSLMQDAVAVAAGAKLQVRFKVSEGGQALSPVTQPVEPVEAPVPAPTKAKAAADSAPERVAT